LADSIAAAASGSERALRLLYVRTDACGWRRRRSSPLL
jgi:hypothetical protein